VKPVTVSCRNTRIKSARVRLPWAATAAPCASAISGCANCEPRNGRRRTTCVPTMTLLAVGVAQFWFLAGGLAVGATRLVLVGGEANHTVDAPRTFALESFAHRSLNYLNRMVDTNGLPYSTSSGLKTAPSLCTCTLTSCCRRHKSAATSHSRAVNLRQTRKASSSSSFS